MALDRKMNVVKRNLSKLLHYSTLFEQINKREPSMRRLSLLCYIVQEGLTKYTYLVIYNISLSADKNKENFPDRYKK